ncbi:MAG TPA: DUF2948 family protein [Vitreimonas sp.]|uniref:DUF2948 family protein n=1 Tax=Vitreimonas sp. TaxID=3069702 RepID=UPI002D71366A|nr:DUF2948 family protein [Vitreimonas sp.]HYD86847.1 DUF2948 family protein [Vitreimonas sp.]
MTAPLKLMAEDAADLEIISAAVQDALVRMGDISIDKRQRRVAILVNRFRWEAADGKRPFERVRSALSFEGVLSVKSRRVRPDAPESVASLLSIGFIPDEEPPGGIVRLMLAGGGEIALEVECLDALLMDMGQAWRTPRRPDHEKL